MPEEPVFSRDDNMRNIILDQDLPNRRQSVRGFEDDRRIYISEAIPGRKLYNCALCSGEIAVTASHVYVEKISARGRYNHRHIHRSCTGTLLQEVVAIEIIPERETRPKKMSKRRHR